MEISSLHCLYRFDGFIDFSRSQLVSIGCVLLLAQVGLCSDSMQSLKINSKWHNHPRPELLRVHQVQKFDTLNIILHFTKPCSHSPHIQVLQNAKKKMPMCKNRPLNIRFVKLYVKKTEAWHDALKASFLH